MHNWNYSAVAQVLNSTKIIFYENNYIIYGRIKNKVVHMNKIQFLASITYSIYSKNTKYNWKSKRKTSVHKTKSKRIALRISTGNFGLKASKLSPEERQINVMFIKQKDFWILEIKRISEKNITLTAHTKNPKHIWLQTILNRMAPKELNNDLKIGTDSGSNTIPVKVILDLDEWKDINLIPDDFLYHTEKHAKQFMRYALDQNFSIYYIPRGREYDLQLISPKKDKIAIAFLSHTAKKDSRSKQHRVQKALIDIAKMIPSLYNEKMIPVIVSQPFSFRGSWDYVGNNYLKFYEDTFGFTFITTEFKEDWEKEVYEKILVTVKNQKDLKYYCERNNNGSV